MKEEVKKISLSCIIGFFAELYNQYSVMLALMITAIVFDVITGILKAKSQGEKLSSGVGTKGFYKKMSFIVAYFFGVFLDLFVPYALRTTGVDLTVNCCFGLIIGAYITLNESISICENLYKINPDIFPEWIVNTLKNIINKIKRGK